MKAFGGVNPFANLSKEDKAKSEQEILDRKALIQQITEKARICLKLEEFSNYAVRYAKAEATLIQLMLDLDVLDPMQEWKQFKELQVQIKTLRSLMNDVTKDAK